MLSRVKNLKAEVHARTHAKRETLNEKLDMENKRAKGPSERETGKENFLEQTLS